MHEEIAKALAVSLALHCVRNTFLEDLHAGITPDSPAGDYSDVKVVTLHGEIPCPRLSRISDDEMRLLMKEVVNKLYTVLLRLDDPAFIEHMERYARLATRAWDEPENLRDWFTAGGMGPPSFQFIQTARRPVRSTESCVDAALLAVFSRPNHGEPTAEEAVCAKRRMERRGDAGQKKPVAGSMAAELSHSRLGSRQQPSTGGAERATRMAARFARQRSRTAGHAPEELAETERHLEPVPVRNSYSL